MKRIRLLILCLFSSILCFAQCYGERSFDIVGLSNKEEIIDALKIGIPLIIIGFLIAYFSMWRKSNNDKRNENGSTVGCIGVIIIVIGFLVLIPLWTWIEAIAVIIVSIAAVLAIILAIVDSISRK